MRSQHMAMELMRLRPRNDADAPPAHPETTGEAAEPAAAAAGAGAGNATGAPGANTRAGRPPRRFIVFYRRQSSGTMHGRTMDLAHEEHLFGIIRACAGRTRVHGSDARVQPCDS
jgi:hypothetical protein